MKKTRYILWITFVEVMGLFSWLLSRGGIERYNEIIEKPVLSPPAIAFPVVWTILYALMGIGAARIAAVQRSPAHAGTLNVFVIQLIVNFFWSLIFFNAQALGFALLWLLLLWALIIVTIVRFFQADRLAALLQIPYLLWVTFAAYLNYAVWQLNR